MAQVVGGTSPLPAFSAVRDPVKYVWGYLVIIKENPCNLSYFVESNLQFGTKPGFNFNKQIQ